MCLSNFKITSEQGSLEINRQINNKINFSTENFYNLYHNKKKTKTKSGHFREYKGQCG